MDPNEALRQLRETAQIIQNYYEAGIDIRDEDAYDLACYCKALDGWMRKGGFSPWETPKREVVPGTFAFRKAQD